MQQGPAGDQLEGLRTVTGPERGVPHRLKPLLEEITDVFFVINHQNCLRAQGTHSEKSIEALEIRIVGGHFHDRTSDIG